MTSLVETVTAKVQGADLAQLAEVAAEKTVSLSIQVGLACLILIGGYLLARIASGAVRSKFAGIKGMDQTLVPILAQSVQYGIIFITLIMTLSNFGIETTSIIAVLGAAGLAIGLALQGTLQNVAAGIMLLVIRPFRKGDFIEAGNISGTVEETGFFITRMHTAQGLYITVPNSMIWSNIITNYSRLPRRRFDLQVGIAYEADIDKARDVIMKLLLDDARVHRSPEPLVVVRALGASSVDLELRVWTDRGSYWELNFDITRKVKLALDEAGISIPYPHQQLVLSPEVIEALSKQGKVLSSNDDDRDADSTENATKDKPDAGKGSGKAGSKKRGRPRNIPA